MKITLLKKVALIRLLNGQLPSLLSIFYTVFLCTNCFAAVVAKDCIELLKFDTANSIFFIQPGQQRVQVDRERLKSLRPEMDKYAPTKVEHKYVKDVLSALSKEDLYQLEKLRDLSIETGRALGLSRSEVEALITKFIDSGLVGGEKHLSNLFSGEQLDVKVKVTNPIGYGGYIPSYEQHVYPKSSFRDLIARYDTKNADHQVRMNKAARMAQANNYLDYNLLTPQETAILSVWYLSTLDQVMQAGLQSAPNDLNIPLMAAPTVLSKALWIGVVGGSILTGFGYYTVGYEALTPLLAEGTVGLVAARAAASTLRRTAPGKWILDKIARRGYSRNSKSSKALRSRLRERNSALMTRLQPADIKPFNFTEPFSPISLALRAEISRLEFRNELFGDLNVMVNGSNASLVAETLEPLVDLASQTAHLQLTRLQQIAAAVESAGENLAEHHVLNLMGYMNLVKDDMAVTSLALNSFKKTLKNAIDLKEDLSSEVETQSKIDELNREIEKNLRRFISESSELEEKIQFQLSK